MPPKSSRKRKIACASDKLENVKKEVKRYEKSGPALANEAAPEVLSSEPITETKLKEEERKDIARKKNKFHKYLKDNGLVIKKILFSKNAGVENSERFAYDLTGLKIKSNVENINDLTDEIITTSFESVAAVKSNKRTRLSSPIHERPKFDFTTQCIKASDDSMRTKIEPKLQDLSRSELIELEDRVYTKLVSYISHHKYKAECFYIDEQFLQKLIIMIRKICDGKLQISVYNKKAQLIEEQINHAVPAIIILYDELTVKDFNYIDTRCRYNPIILLTVLEQKQIKTDNLLMLLEKCCENEGDRVDVKNFMLNNLVDIQDLKIDFANFADLFIREMPIKYKERFRLSDDKVDKDIKTLFYNNLIAWTTPGTIVINSFVYKANVLSIFRKKVQFIACGNCLIRYKNLDPTYDWINSQEFCGLLKDCLYNEIKNKKNINEAMVKSEIYGLLKLLPNGVESECSIPNPSGHAKFSDLTYTYKDFGLIVETKRTIKCDTSMVNVSLLSGVDQVETRYVKKFEHLKKQAFLVIDVVGEDTNLKINYIFKLLYHQKGNPTTNYFLHHLSYNQDDILVQFVTEDLYENLAKCNADTEKIKKGT